jgi:hypothetical protein
MSACLPFELPGNASLLERPTCGYLAGRQPLTTMTISPSAHLPAEP